MLKILKIAERPDFFCKNKHCLEHLAILNQFDQNLRLFPCRIGPYDQFYDIT